MADRLTSFPVHLGRGGKAFRLPEFTGGMEWYETYGKLHPDDGADGWLVSMHTFSESWDTWEVHPNGHEIVVCIAGSMSLIQEAPDGARSQVTLEAGEYAINLPGVWHTADLDAPATALFITSGEGTAHRPRSD